MFNFYVLAFDLVYFPGDIYENSFCMAVSDIFAYIVSCHFVNKFSIHKSLIMTYIISGLGSILYLCFKQNTSLIPIFIMLCRIGTTM